MNTSVTENEVDSFSDKKTQYEILLHETQTVRKKDEIIVRSLFGNFYNKKLGVGVGYKMAFGSILSGDYFDLIKLPDMNYLFVFADLSGHGLPAYANSIRLRSAITLSIREWERVYKNTGIFNTDYLVRSITSKFSDIMQQVNSEDFASVIFTFIYNDNDKFHLRFYNRSMLFPIIIRKFQNRIMEMYNLNRAEKGWVPGKGHLLCSDLRDMLGEEYFTNPRCDFTIYEGDSILFFSDGIIEACSADNPADVFTQSRIERILRDRQLPPQGVVDALFEAVYSFIGNPSNQKDDMTAVLIDFPIVRG